MTIDNLKRHSIFTMPHVTSARVDMVDNDLDRPIHVSTCTMCHEEYLDPDGVEVHCPPCIKAIATSKTMEGIL